MYTAGRQGPVATTRVGGYARQRDPRGHGEGPRTAPVCSRRRDPSTPKGAVYAWTKWLAVAIAAGSITTGVAIAGSGKSETTAVMGTFEVAQVGKAKQHQCDAKHVRIKTRFEGDQASSDSRLAGQLEIKATSVVSTENGYGRSKGTFVLRRTYSPGATFRGEFVAVLEPDGGGEGFLTGGVPRQASAASAGQLQLRPDLARPPQRRVRDRQPAELAVLRGGPGPGDPHQRLLRQEARSRPRPRRRRPPLNLPTCAGTCSIGSGAHRT